MSKVILKIEQMFLVLKKIGSRKILFLNVIFFLVSICLSLANITIPLLQKYLLQGNDVFKNSNASFIYFVTSIAFLVLIFFESLICKLLSLLYKREIEKVIIINGLTCKNNNLSKYGSGAFTSAMFGDSEMMAQALSTNFYYIISSLLTTIFILIFTITWSYKFFLVSTISLVVLIILSLLSNRYSVKNFELGRKKIYELNPKVIELFKNRVAILSNGDYISIANNIFAKSKERDSFFLKSGIFKNLLSSLSNSLPTLSFAIFLIISLSDLKNGTLSIEVLIVFISYFAIIYKPVNLLQELNENIKIFDAFYKRQKTCFESEHPDLPFSSDVSFINCSFSRENKEIFSDVSFDLNQVIGIVGISGIGKTTLINLLLGEISPNKGEIVLGGVNVTKISKKMMYQLINVLPQEPLLFNESIEFNITLGKMGLSEKEFRSKKDKFINNCLFAINGNNKKDSNDDYNFFLEVYFEKITRQGLETILRYLQSLNKQFLIYLISIAFSKKYYSLKRYNFLLNTLKLDVLGDRNIGDDGAYISGGEKSRVSIARFMLDDINRIFVLDEPLSGLDALSRNFLLDFMKKNMKFTKGIIISHDLKTINDLSDSLCLVEHNHLYLYRNHDEAFNKSILYQEIYNAYRKFE